MNQIYLKQKQKNAHIYYFILLEIGLRQGAKLLNVFIFEDMN